MDAGTLLWILLIGGGVVAMVFMHRGGHAHGGLGGGCGAHGHDHGQESTDETREPRANEKNAAAASGSHEHGREPATAGGKHRGC